MFEINKQIGIYIHFPWCVRKCHTDFNSHTIRDNSYPLEQVLLKTYSRF